MMWGRRKNTHQPKLSVHLLQEHTHQHTTGKKNSQQAISPPPSCLPHSAPECQKAVQWGVLQQRSAYGNAPADTLLLQRAEREEMKPSRQKPDVY